LATSLRTLMTRGSSRAITSLHSRIRS
jgi:hypothetical protein